MKILFDHNVDRRFRRHLIGHDVSTTRERRWETLVNGKLLKVAADAGFDLFLSIDKKLEYEQNLKTLPIAVVVVDSVSNALPALIPFAGEILRLLKYKLDPMLFVVSMSGTIVITEPRR